MAYTNLVSYFTMNFVMQQNGFVISHLDNIVPWERSAYFDIMKMDLEKKAKGD